jgi:hypothetical protein
MPGYSPLNSQFDNFLFAPIGEEKNEMLLSVVSPLARLGVDPWQEAARLTQLPKELATQSLASMVEALPSGRWAPSDSTAIAARLVQLLPSLTKSKTSPIAANSDFRQEIRSLAMMWLIYTVIWGAALMMVGNLGPPSRLNHDTHSTGSPPQIPLRGAD